VLVEHADPTGDVDQECGVVNTDAETVLTQ
jgi:hypothetical protein